GIKRIDMLNDIVNARIKELRLGDAIEVYLYYQVKLKDELKLPVSTQGMLYEGMAGISDEILITDSQKVSEASSSLEQICDILMEYTQWEERMKDSASAEFEKINDDISDRISAVSDDHALTQKVQVEKIADLKIDHSKRWRELLKLLTLK